MVYFLFLPILSIVSFLHLTVVALRTSSLHLPQRRVLSGSIVSLLCVCCLITR